MTLTIKNPRSTGTYTTVEKLFRDQLNESFFTSISEKTRFAAVDIYESGTNLVLKLEAPGYDKDDISVEYDNELLVIKSAVKPESEEKSRLWIKNEISKHGFSRTFHLPDNLDANSAKASFKNGVLTIKIPFLKNESEVVKITIE